MRTTGAVRRWGPASRIRCVWRERESEKGREWVKEREPWERHRERCLPLHDHILEQAIQHQLKRGLSGLTWGLCTGRSPVHWRTKKAVTVGSWSWAQYVPPALERTPLNEWKTVLHWMNCLQTQTPLTHMVILLVSWLPPKRKPSFIPEICDLLSL